MALEDLNQQRQAQSSLTLSNAVNLVSAVIEEIAGNDISTSLNGTHATTEVIEALSHQRILTKLNVK